MLIIPGPVDTVTVEDVKAAAPNLDDAEAQRMAAAINAQVRRVAPCFAEAASEDMVAEARQIVSTALRRAASVASWVQSETTGPKRVDYWRQEGAGVLNSAEERQLAALCPIAPQGAGRSGAQAAFPDPSGLEALFPVRLRRLPWQ